MNTKKQERRKSALKRLQAQLSSGVKTINDSKVKVDLTETDKARIKNEIQTLKSRI